MFLQPPLGILPGAVKVRDRFRRIGGAAKSIDERAVRVGIDERSIVMNTPPKRSKTLR